MLGGIPKPLDLALFTEEFEDEVQAAFPPRWLQRLVPGARWPGSPGAAAAARRCPDRGAEEPFVGWLGFVDVLKKLNERKEQQ